MAEEGQNVTLVCSASGQPKPLLTWSKPIGSLPLQRMRVTDENLTILNVKMADSGHYVCQATNKLATKTTAGHLVVVSQLRFIIRPPRVYRGRLGRAHVINCMGGSKQSVTWVKEGSITLPVGVQVTGNGSLVIAAATIAHQGTYRCIIGNGVRVITSTMILRQVNPQSCSELKTFGEPTGSYVIDPDGAGGVAPFTVHCDMTDKNGVGVTVIRHDSQHRTLVNGYEPPGSYSRNIRYTGASLSQLSALTRVSVHCEQFIKYECYDSVLLYNGSPQYGWWVSRNGQKMTYWGGAEPVRGNYKCACGMTNSCANPSDGCNCDKNDEIWREDSGLLTDKSTLPVSQLRFGDTSGSERAYHTLGELKCYGGT